MQIIKSVTEMETDALQQGYEAIKEELARRNDAVRLEKARELDEKAREMGFLNLQDAVKALAGKSAPRKVAPKYANPDNPTETWAGRGMQPKWLVAYLDKGGSLDDIRIQKSDDD